MSFSAYELLIANINWYCRLLCLYGQGTAVAVILAVRLCLPFIWTFSCLSFPSFVCFLFTPPVVLCHNKVSYIPSSDIFLILLSLWLILLFVFPLHHSPPPPPPQKKCMDGAEMGQGACYSAPCDVGSGVYARVFFGPAGLVSESMSGEVWANCVTSATYHRWCKSVSFASCTSCNLSAFVFMDAACEGEGGSPVLTAKPRCLLTVEKNTNVAASGSAASTLFRSASVRVW